ncbi:MAG: L,D-transpeptidase family protein [Brooklawnia sp.]|uniref:L,D-transpeptidase family protein n=1 Tax=Brooklawnia sp. TaxID=2699740 RepID=UPI003C7567AB
MKQTKPRRLGVALWILFGAFVILGSATGAYAAHFSSHGLPRVTILGESITNQSQQEVAEALAERADEVTVAVELDGRTTEYTLADLGFEVDAEATASNAFQQNANFTSRMQALYTEREVPVVVVADDARTETLLDDLVAETGVPAEDATVRLSEDGSQFTVTPAVEGRSVDASAVIRAATTAAETLTSTTVELTIQDLPPKVTDEQAQAVADKANGYIALDIAIAGRISTIAPYPAEKAQWVSIPTDEQGHLGEPVLDDAAVAEWVTAAGQASGLEPVNGVRNVDANGQVVGTPQQGSDGFRVNNAAVVAEEVVAAVRAGESYSGAFRYDTIEPTYTNRVIAAGAQNLVYQAAPGEKWIDLNLGNNTVTAYQGSTVAMGPTYIVPGMPGMETPTGTFNVYLKYTSQTMRGTNLDGTPYVAPGVPWVTYFTGPIAFHGAPWRDSFGWSGPGGSHGCVNMTVDAARFIHDWAPMGTVVVSHY